jgi:2-deoxy-D-gluconate 3-dehydrogenase
LKVVDLFRLEGKTALVTGCRRGIGRAMAVALAEAGADIIGVSASMEREGSAVGNEVHAAGRNFRGYACDLGDRQALYSFLERLKGEAAPIDILVITPARFCVSLPPNTRMSTGTGFWR